MSIQPGETIQKDPSAEILYTFNWEAWLGAAEIDDYSIVITGGPDSALEQDNDGLVAGNQKVEVLLKAGTLNKKYTVTCRITTNEVVPQTDDRSIVVWVRNQ